MSDLAMSGMVLARFRRCSAGEWINASFGAGLEPVMKRDIEMDSSWDLQKARFLDSLMPSSSYSFKAQIKINVSSYQQISAESLFPSFSNPSISAHVLNQWCTATEDGVLAEERYGSPQIFGNHVVRTKIFEASYDLGRSSAIFSRIMPLKNQGFKPGGSRTCIWPSFRPMFCRCSAGGKKPDEKNDHWSKQNLQLRRVWTISLWRANQHWSILCWIWRGIRFRQNKSSIAGRKKSSRLLLVHVIWCPRLEILARDTSGDMRPTLRQLNFDHSPKLFPRLRTKLSWSLAWRSPDPYLQERRPRRIYKRASQKSFQNWE